MVALSGAGDSGHLISGDDEADRFILALLRASADAVLIGAGTFRKANGDLWHPETVYPAAEEVFAELRQPLGLRPHPLLVVITASGLIDVAQPALRDSLVITTPQGETRLRGTLPSGARISVFTVQPIGGRSALDFLHTQCLQVVLAEGGPSLVGQLLEGGLIDELFLTTSPRLFGRQTGDGRQSLVEEVHLGGRSMTLSRVRRHASHLYLHYSL